MNQDETTIYVPFYLKGEEHEIDYDEVPKNCRHILNRKLQDTICAILADLLGKYRVFPIFESSQIAIRKPKKAVDQRSKELFKPDEIRTVLSGFMREKMSPILLKPEDFEPSFPNPDNYYLALDLSTSLLDE